METKAKAKRVDWSKPIQTRDGRPARLLGDVRVKSGNECHVVVAVQSKYGEYEGVYLCSDSGAVRHSKERIINVPQKHVRWLNVYLRGPFAGYLHEQKDQADAIAGRDRIACVRIEFTEGEGLTDDAT